MGISADGLIGGLKSKLGLGPKEDEYDDYEDDYEDEDEGEDERIDARPVPSYRNEPVVTTRAGSARHASASHPNLISREDVRAHTRFDEASAASRADAYDSSRGSFGSASYQDPLGAPAETRPRSFGAAPAPSFEFRSPYEAVDAQAGFTPARSEGLNSLFAPSAPAPQPAAMPSAQYTPSSGYEVRPMSVYAPYSIEQTEYICASLRNGDVVVLNLRDTAAELAARILDFTFGAASMVGAQVDCPAPRVFVVCQGAALSQSETASLQKQGVL